QALCSLGAACASVRGAPGESPAGSPDEADSPSSLPSNPFLKLRIEEPRDAPSLGSFELPNRSRRMTRMMSSSWARMPPTIETSERQVQSPYRPVPGAASNADGPLQRIHQDA